MLATSPPPAPAHGLSDMSTCLRPKAIPRCLKLPRGLYVIRITIGFHCSYKRAGPGCRNENDMQAYWLTCLDCSTGCWIIICSTIGGRIVLSLFDCYSPLLVLLLLLLLLWVLKPISDYNLKFRRRCPICPFRPFSLADL